MKPASVQTAQTGSALLEALVAVLVFSFGILALVSMQSAAVRNTSEAKYRADASFLANEIIGQIWANVATPVSAINLATYVTGPAAGAAVCAAGSVGAGVSGWLGEVARLLPGAERSRQQIAVAGNQVTVTVCWPDQNVADQWHHHVITAEVFK